MLLKDIIYKGIETVSTLYPEGEAREMVFAYMEDVFGLKRYVHILEPGMTLEEGAVQKAMSGFSRMAAGEPLQYITGTAHFYGRRFRVTPDVLIPRQETESLCNELLYPMVPKTPVFATLAARCKGPLDRLLIRSRPLAGGGMSSPPFGHNNSIPVNDINPAILDLCTGSGCIAWTLALEIPGSHVTAVDISDGALSVASSQDFSEEMASTGAVSPQFIKADVLQGPENCKEICGRQFDIIVSNPPYVMDSEKALMRTNVLDHEPHLALFVPDEDPLKFYKAIALWALALLKAGGTGIVEINEALGKETAQVFVEAGLKDVEILKDLHGKDRFVRFKK